MGGKTSCRKKDNLDIINEQDEKINVLKKKIKELKEVD